MMIIPTDIPPAPDFGNLAAWIGGGISIVIVIAGATFAGLRTAFGIAKTIKEALPEERPSTIVTTDTVAMNSLAMEMRANTTAMIENNGLHRELLLKANNFFEEAAADRAERATNEEIKRLLREELANLGPTRRPPRRPP